MQLNDLKKMTEPFNSTEKMPVLFLGHGSPFELSIPTPEHYLPLLYVLALQDENDKTTLFNDKALAGSLTMTSVIIDRV